MYWSIVNMPHKTDPGLAILEISDIQLSTGITLLLLTAILGIHHTVRVAGYGELYLQSFCILKGHSSKKTDYFKNSLLLKKILHGFAKILRWQHEIVENHRP